MASKSIISETKAKPDDAPEDYPKVMSKGERLFNWLTYGGVAGIGTFIFTVPIAYWAKYGGGAEGFKWAGKVLRKTGISESTAEHALMTTATMQGGNATIPFVKVMENYKPALVEKFNSLLGEKDEAEEIKKEPKQTWGSLIKARIFMAWLPVFLSFKGAAMLLGENKFTAFNEAFAKHVVCKPMGKLTHINMNGAMQETKIFRYGKIAALDVFATTAAAVLLFIGSRIFAERKRKKDGITPPSDNVPTKNNAEAPAPAEDCLPCRLKSYTSSLSPAGSYAGTVASEKAKASETPLGINA